MITPRRGGMSTPNVTRWKVLEIASRVWGHIDTELDGALLSCGSRGRSGVLYTKVATRLPLLVKLSVLGSFSVPDPELSVRKGYRAAGVAEPGGMRFAKGPERQGLPHHHPPTPIPKLPRASCPAALLELTRPSCPAALLELTRLSSPWAREEWGQSTTRSACTSPALSIFLVFF
jgi:hypothetical protein